MGYESYILQVDEASSLASVSEEITLRDQRTLSFGVIVRSQEILYTHSVGAHHYRASLLSIDRDSIRLPVTGVL